MDLGVGAGHVFVGAAANDPVTKLPSKLQSAEQYGTGSAPAATSPRIARAARRSSGRPTGGPRQRASAGDAACSAGTCSSRWNSPTTTAAIAAATVATRKRGVRPGDVDDLAGDGGADGHAQAERRADPGERLGDRRPRHEQLGEGEGADQRRRHRDAGERRRTAPSPRCRRTRSSGTLQHGQQRPARRPAGAAAAAASARCPSRCRWPSSRAPGRR